MSVQTTSNAVAQNERLAQLIKAVTTNDSLLDYKIKHLLDVLSENLELLHSEIIEGETKDVLVHRYNKLTALFETFVNLLPTDSGYFEKVNSLTCLISKTA